MRFAEHLHDAGARERRVRVLAGHLSRLIPREISVLDVGSGDGRIALTLSALRPDLDIRGVDVLVRPEAAIPVHHYDGLRLPFGDKVYGATVLVDVLHHCQDPAAVLAEAARVASVVIVKDHVADTALAVRILRFMDRVGNARFGVSLPYNYLTRAQWEGSFASLGLVVEAWVGTLGLYPLPISWLFDGSLHFATRLRG